MKNALRWIVFNIVPTLLFLSFLIFDNARNVLIFLCVIYGICLQIYGKNYKGQNVILGILTGERSVSKIEKSSTEN